MTHVLIGAGKHAHVVYELARSLNFEFSGYVDPLVKFFFNIKILPDEIYDNCIMGIGGVTPDALMRRHSVFEQYKNQGSDFSTLISPHSIVSVNAKISDGVIINHGAIVQYNSNIHSNVIINTGAIVEHDAIVESGTHVAPGAIILGSAHIGKCCLIGAGAMILPGSIVPDNTLVPAMAKYKNA